MALRDNVVEAGVAKSAKSPHEYEATESSQTRDGFKICVRSMQRIQTAAEAMEKAGIDDAIWEPTKVTANSWEVAVRMIDKTIETKPLWQVKVECKRRVAVDIELSADALAKRVAKGKFSWQPIKRRSKKKDLHKLFIGLVDHHYGKLCWGQETGTDYDLSIARELHARAIDESMSEVGDRNISEIVIPIGNDYGHIDTRAATTESGTPQDADGRYERIAAVMEEGMISAIAQARQIAPVRVIWVQGNHDPVVSMWLCRVAYWAFHGDKHVTVDTSPNPLKMVHFGKCLVGLAHGDKPKPAKLKDLMPVTWANEWAASTACREWLTGHTHQQQQTERVGTAEQAGQVFRVLPSLCGTDSWHARNGYSMSKRATQNYLYSHEHGLVGFQNIPISKLVD